MGGSVSHCVGCFIRPREASSDGGVGVLFSEPLDEGLGHSFCYVRPQPGDTPPISPEKEALDEFPLSTGKIAAVPCGDESPVVADSLRPDKVSEKGKLSSDKGRSLCDKPSNEKPKTTSETSFKSISGASVSANTATPRSIMSTEQFNSFSNVLYDRAAAFESTSSFSALPLQPVPRGFSGPLSGPLDRGDRAFMSGPLERGFLSGPLERGFLSGPLERSSMSGPLEAVDRSHFSAPLGGIYHPYSSTFLKKRKKSLARFMRSMTKPMKRVLSKTAYTLSRTHKSLVAPVKGYVFREGKDLKTVADKECPKGARKSVDSRVDIDYPSSDLDLRESDNLQWAQGKAGEDRVHVVLSEEHGWLFVGIYDGFNGPDAPDFLMSNLYPAVHQELKGLLWDKDDEHKEESASIDSSTEWEVEDGGRQTDGGESTAGGNVRGSKKERFRREGEREWGRKRNPWLLRVGHDGRRWSRNANGRSESKNQFTKTENVEEDSPSVVSTEGKSAESRVDLEETKERMSSLCQASHSVFEYDEVKQVESSSNCEQTVDDNSEERLALEQEGKLSEDRMNDPADDEDREQPVQLTSLNDETSTSKDQKPGRRKAPLGIKLRHGHERRKEQLRKYFQWRYGWDINKVHEGLKTKDVNVAECRCDDKESKVDHSDVLKALSNALQATENAYLEMADKAMFDFPELALMGSCVLVMLMKDEDVYILNVGDSRAVLAQHPNPEPFMGKVRGYSQSNGNDPNERNGARDPLLQLELERIIEETPMELEALESAYDSATVRDPSAFGQSLLGALQLTSDHSTSIDEEVLRIKSEHPDCDTISNDRVKGRLKVTRAFGAGFLKQPKWNNALLEMFRINFIGTDPYITCTPALYHHKLGPQDHFLVLSSDGLYQYLSNEEVVSHVEWFMEKFPDGDPAQHLIEELLFRAAKKAGMDFHELLDIPQGDRRKYHDDVSVMVISLEGRIWRSSGAEARIHIEEEKQKANGWRKWKQNRSRMSKINITSS